jgi:hypothetical protein
VSALAASTVTEKNHLAVTHTFQSSLISVPLGARRADGELRFASGNSPDSSCGVYRPRS